MTYQEAVGYLDSFLNYERTTAYRYPEAFSLDRVRQLLERLGDPHLRYPSVHVAGTKGKGSTCAFIARVLSAAGLKTGLYTSPHLISFRERIQVDGEPISEQELTGVVEQVRQVAPQGLTFFEVTTACALLHFAQVGVEAAVVEVGLGGRLDATNVLTPEVCVITPVSRDHMPKLGNTVEEITREKAGILKQSVPAVLSPQQPEGLRVVETAAASRDAPLHRVEREMAIEELAADLSGSRVNLRSPERTYRNLRIPLAGRHQQWNAAAAVRAAELFLERGRVPAGSESARSPAGRLEDWVREGLSRTVWPGRCQWVPGAPSLLLDGAQNAASARALRDTVTELAPGRRVTLVVGCSQEKDLKGIAREWAGWADRIVLTRANVPRAESVEDLRRAFRSCAPGLEERACVEEALERARTLAGGEGLVVVSGSLFVVGEALASLCGSPAAKE